MHVLVGPPKLFDVLVNRGLVHMPPRPDWRVGVVVKPSPFEGIHWQICALDPSCGLMGLAQTKREYIDRDISPEMLTLIRLAEALSPKVICALLIVGLVATSQSILTFCRWVHTLFRPTPAGRTRLPTIT